MFFFLYFRTRLHFSTSDSRGQTLLFLYIMTSNHLKLWRRHCKNAAAIALDSSSEDSGPADLDPKQCDGPTEDSASENVEPSQPDVDLTVEGNGTLGEELDELHDTDSDFGYREYASSSTDYEQGLDSEQGFESKKRRRGNLSRKAWFLGYKK